MQTSVSMNPNRARAGLAAFAFNAQDVRSMLAEGAVPFGRVVVEGTSTRQGKVPSADTQVVAGISMLTQAIESPADGLAPGYSNKQAMNVMNFGPIWVQTMDTNLPTATAIYAKVGTSDAGKLTLTSSGNINLSAKLVLRELDTENKLALVEFREKL